MNELQENIPGGSILPTFVFPGGIFQGVAWYDPSGGYGSGPAGYCPWGWS